MMGRKPKQQTSADQWLQKIERAKNVRKKWRDDFRIPLAYEYWEGRQRPSHIPSGDWITINMIYSNLQAELPTLYSTDPYFYVKVKKSYSPNPMDIAAMELKAKVRQSMINYLKGELALKSKGRLAIFDAFFQFGVVKIHYSNDMRDNPDAGNPVVEQETGHPILDETGQIIMEPDQIPANEAYHVTRVHPDDFLVDDDAGPLDEDVGWKAQRIKRLLSDVKADKRYSKTGRDAVQATEIKDDDQKEREQRKKGGMASKEKSDVEPDIAVLWELYDIKKNQWLVVAEGSSEFLIDPEPLPEGIERDPFVDLRFTMRDDSWYPMPPVSQWLDSQREYCELRSKYMVHRKRFNRKYTAYLPAFDDPMEAMAKIEVGEDGTVVGQNQPLQSVWPIQDAPLDQNHVIEMQAIRQDFMDLAVGPNQRGATSGVDSATEAGILEKRTQIREGDKLGQVSDFLQIIARKLDQLVQANITQDQAVKIAGPRGESWEMIRTLDYQQIAGEYEYSIDVGQTTPQLPEIERAQWMAFLQLIANAPQLALSPALLKRMAELHHISDEMMLEELNKIAQMMMQQQAGPTPQTGSLPNVTESKPLPAMLGAAVGMNNIGGGLA
jgi:hypothetical protein